jgi:hypothetical protein
MNYAFLGYAKAQSAMEYLMTYGWAILIIAVVLGALFELGVFSGAFFMPHVPPGSCHVFRPYGPRTVGSINLEGECQGALPQYVAGFNGNSYVEQSDGFSFINNANQNVTISIWVNPSSPNGDIVDELGQSSIDTDWHDTWIDLVNGNVQIRVWDLSCVDLGSIPLNSWSNIVMILTYNGVALNYSGYINGVYRGSGSGSRSVPGGSSIMYYPLGPSDFTNCGDGSAAFSGEMANYQFYNTSLSKQSIYEIYQEGIGGSPINLQNLVGWWPLNGNGNDYSGNNNDGTAAKVIYTSNWESGYTQP